MRGTAGDSRRDELGYLDAVLGWPRQCRIGRSVTFHSPRAPPAFVAAIPSFGVPDESEIAPDQSPTSNSCFISYRRDTSGTLAIAIFQQLSHLNIDCFYDIESLRAGQFEEIILGQIAARPYFLLVLSPGCLNRCQQDADWLRRELEEAVRLGRTVIPLISEGFSWSEVGAFLPPHLATAVRGHNGLELPQKFFKYAMQELASEWLLPRAIPQVARAGSPHEAQIIESMKQAAAETAVTVEDLRTENEYARWVSLVADAPSPPPPEPPVDEPGYSVTEAAKIVGITYRQLDYWARTDLIRPSLVEPSGGGSRRRYSYRDLLELRVIKTLLDAGIRLESVREVFSFLREHVTTDISSANIVITGTSVVLCENDELIDLLRSGQGPINVLPLSGVKNDIDEQLHPPFEEGDRPRSA